LAYQHNRPASNHDDRNAGGTDNLSAGHTTGLAINHAVMLSISLVWWPLVRIERNLQSIRGGLVGSKLRQLTQFQASTPDIQQVIK